TGVAESNDLSADGIRRTADMARAIAQLQPEDPNTLPLPQAEPAQKVNAFFPGTANFTPEARARAIETITRQAAASGLVAAGAFRTDALELAVANSLGAFNYHSGTVADLHTVVMNDASGGSGYASTASPDVKAI